MPKRMLARLAGTVLTICLTTQAGAQLKGKVPPPAPAPAANALPPYQAVQGGEVQLPTTGLLLTLTDDPARDYRLSSSWSLIADQKFDSRDVIDEFDARSGQLVRGNWVLTGYFTPGNCTATLAGMRLEKRWTLTRTQWGHTWEMTGGDFRFDGPLGLRPMTAMCRSLPGGRSLILQRFITDQPPGRSQADMLADLTRASVLAAASRAFDQGAWRESKPLHQRWVTTRGTQPATRTVTLPIARLTLTLPNDGGLWIVPPRKEGATSDWLDRLLPSLPEISVEVMRFPRQTCAAVLQQLGQPQLTPAQQQEAARPLTGMPIGWIAGPMLAVEAQSERTACASVNGDAVLVGMFLGKGNSDATPVAGLLGALQRARVAPN